MMRDNPSVHYALDKIKFMTPYEELDYLSLHS